MKHSKRTDAFTLVELSIVIVIIGLIVSGVTAGSTLARQAKLRSIITDINRYRTAVNTFKLQYNALPGDMANAVSFWGATTTGGNANGVIQWSNEAYLAWQHLALAKLIEGTYTGVATATYADPGINVPRGTIADSAYNIRGDTQYNYSGSGSYPLIMFGKRHTGTWADTSVVTTTEAYSIDIKNDDGNAGTGKIQGFEGDEYTPVATCATPYYTANRQYMLSNTNIVCTLIFKI